MLIGTPHLENAIVPKFIKPWLLFLVVMVVYIPATQNDFIWDDDHHVGFAPKFYEHGLANGLKTIWLDPFSGPQYYPMVWSSYLIEHHFWGQDPVGYHIVNMVLHASVALLLWLVLCHLGAPWPFAAAILFALHPVQVESVAWVSERKNVLSGLFYMSALLTFLKWHAKRVLAPPNGGANALYYASAGLFLAALASKTVTATLPFVIILLLWWKQSLNKEIIGRLIPFMVVGIAMGCITAWLEQGHAGAVGIQWEFSFIERCLIAAKSLCFYISKLVIPTNLTFIYPRWQIDATEILQYSYLTIILLSLVGLWLARSRFGNGPLAATLIFMGTLFPALGFINLFPMQFSFVADHFQYLASAAMITLIVALGHLGFKHINKGVLTVAFLALCVVYSVTTWKLQKQYKNQTVLWESTIHKNPKAWIAHGNLGAGYLNEKRYEKAIKSLETSIALNPNHIINYNNMALVYFNLAQSEPQASYTDKALTYGYQALKLGDQERQYLEDRLVKPRAAEDHAVSHRIMGDIKSYLNDTVGARYHYESILAMHSRNTGALKRLGALHLEEKNYLDALKYFKKSLSIDPLEFDTLYNTGVVLYKLGNKQQARPLLLQALEQGSTEGFLMPHYYLGLIAKDKGNGVQAKQHFEIVATQMQGQSMGNRALQELLQLE